VHPESGEREPYVKWAESIYKCEMCREIQSLGVYKCCIEHCLRQCFSCRWLLISNVLTKSCLGILNRGINVNMVKNLSCLVVSVLEHLLVEAAASCSLQVFFFRFS
jgi:hypothetical protein